MSSEQFEAITLERILERDNLMKAMTKVRKKGGSAGVDGMKTTELKAYIKAHPKQLTTQILQGSFRPSPIKRTYIPKDNGEQRPLGIPTVIDRFVQQAIALVMSEEYEKVFVDHSYGFRPNRSCRQAVRQAMQHIKDGYLWVIDLDLRKFFDTVNHSKLIQLLSERIKDGRVISLIHKFLQAPISEEGKVGPKNMIGTPQGGVISPICANVLLHEFDVKLVEKGMRACRYADDAIIFCKSRKAAERALVWIKKFLEEKLLLKINETKTKILNIGNPEVQFLGFSFTSRVSKAKKLKFPDYKFFPVVHRKKMKKLREEIKHLLDRRAPKGIEEAKRRLRLKLRGWTNYFLKAIPKTWMEGLDEWIHRKIRQLLWKQWKKRRKRFEEFRKRWKNAPGIKDYAYSNNNYWRMARTPQIHTALSVKRLRSEGWSDLYGTLKGEIGQ